KSWMLPTDWVPPSNVAKMYTRWLKLIRRLPTTAGKSNTNSVLNPSRCLNQESVAHGIRQQQRENLWHNKKCLPTSQKFVTSASWLTSTPVKPPQPSVFCSTPV